MEEVLPYIIGIVIGSLVTVICFLIRNNSNRAKGLAGNTELCKQVSSGITEATARIERSEDTIVQLISEGERITDIFAKYGEGDKSPSN